MILYSLRTDKDGYRITKFDDGEPQGSYIVSTMACDCPAGHRHTCRHRQMLPQMLAHKLCDTHWFFCFDTGGQIVDFNGTSKHLLDQLAAPGHTDLMISPEAIEAELSRTQEETVEDTSSLPKGVQMFDLSDLGDVHNAIAEAVGEAPVPAGQHCQGSKSWRRL